MLMDNKPIPEHSIYRTYRNNDSSITMFPFDRIELSFVELRIQYAHMRINQGLDCPYEVIEDIRIDCILRDLLIRGYIIHLHNDIFFLNGLPYYYLNGEYYET